MVVVHVHAGLGNQLFQYAAARAVADRHGTSLGIDLRSDRKTRKRRYGLDAFHIRATIVPAGDVVGLHAPRGLRWRLTRGLAERLRATLRPGALSGLTRVIESSAGYTELLARAPDNIWMSGYWQSERYFAEIADRIRADLTLRRVSEAAAALDQTIQAMAHPVAVHVRRGDYALNPVTREHHGLCGLDYYAAAIQRVRATSRAAQFVFFSDDPDWVAQHLGRDAALIVRPRSDGQSDAEDIFLMSRCRAHVIANSSFSWWGAWLANSPLVVAPRRWFQQIEAPDLVPTRWERL